MKWMAILWAVILNIIIVIVSIGIIGAFAHDTSSQTTIALLLFIYVNIKLMLTVMLRSQLQLTIFLTVQNSQIIESIPGSNSDIANNLRNETEEAQKKLNDTNVKYYINTAGNILVWIIAILTILGNTL